MQDLQRDDIQAFQRRLKEILTNNESGQRRWRVKLLFCATLFAIGSVLLYNDYNTYKERTVVEHLKSNKLFSGSAIVLLILFVIFKAHKRSVAKNILAERTRQVLSPFALTCNDDGEVNYWPNPPTNTEFGEEFCSICSDQEGDNDDLCFPEEEERNDIYYPYYNNN